MNLLDTNKDYMANFAENESSSWCARHNFLPCLKPEHEKRLGTMWQGDDETSKYFLAGTYDPELYHEMLEMRDNGESVELKRNKDTIIPTAFVYGSDNIPVEEQMANVKEEGWDLILSATACGDKSLHIVVPIPMLAAPAVRNPERYKFCWEDHTILLFKNPSLLDKKFAKIGVKSYYPGYNDPEAGESHRCLYYKPFFNTLDPEMIR